MQHVAILKPSWKILPKILSGEKTIETRWYINKVAPWNRVNSEDTIFFKDSGKPITTQAIVDHVEQYEFSAPTDIYPILLKYKSRLGFNDNAFSDLSWLKGKRYGILIFIKNVTETKPINISKKGFGSAAAWLCLQTNIEDYRL